MRLEIRAKRIHKESAERDRQRQYIYIYIYIYRERGKITTKEDRVREVREREIERASV